MYIEYIAFIPDHASTHPTIHPSIHAHPSCVGSGSGSGSESDGSQRSEEEDDGVSFMAYLSLQKSLKTVTDQRIKV